MSLSSEKMMKDVLAGPKRLYAKDLNEARDVLRENGYPSMRVDRERTALRTMGSDEVTYVAGPVNIFGTNSKGEVAQVFLNQKMGESDDQENPEVVMDAPLGGLV